jgi:hypothetical protein
MDVDDSASEEELQKGIGTNDSSERADAASLSLFIHITRLRRIESNIQQSVYRVDRSSSLPAQVIDCFIAELSKWKDQIPKETTQDTEVSPYDGYYYYLVYYNKALQLLLYPQLATADADTHIIKKCAEACGGVCRSYKQLHHQTNVGFSLMALHSVFLSGLTLLYCLWLAPKEVYTITTSNDLNACSIVLYVITERWPGARKYRDAFETIRQCVLDLIATSDQPRKPLSGLNADLRATLSDVQKLNPEGRSEFTRMMTDMVGGGDSQHVIAVTPQTFQAPFENTAPGQLEHIPGYAHGTGMTPLYDMGGAMGDSQYTGTGQPLSAMDLLDGFDMEDFLSSSNFYGDPLL